MRAAAATTGSWQCSVCGYVHRGAEPPEFCPICGADRTQFVPYREPSGAVRPAARRWRCLNCSYRHGGDEPPVECPVCAAPAARFEPVEEVAAGGRGLAGPIKVVIFGAGIAGVSAVESVRRAAPEAEITLLSREPELPYYRLNLSRLLAGRSSRKPSRCTPPPGTGSSGSTC